MTKALLLSKYLDPNCSQVLGSILHDLHEDLLDLDLHENLLDQVHQTQDPCS